MKRAIIVPALFSLLGVCIAPGPLVAQASARVESADLPSAEKVMADAVKALGGRAAIDKVETIHSVSVMAAMGQKINTDNSCSRKGACLSRMTIPMGEMVSGSDGSVAWRKTPMGYMLLEGDEAGQVRQAAMHLWMIDPERTAKEEFKSIEVVAKEKFDGRECYKLRSVDKGGKEGSIYFDASTGLPAGFDMEQSQKGRTGRGMMVLSDWKAVEGVKFFHAMKMEMPDAPAKPESAGPESVQITYTKIEVNTLKDDAFALPDEVKKLAASHKPDAAGGGAEEIKLEDLSKEDQAEAKQMIEGMKAMPPEHLRKTVSQLEKYMDMMPEAQKKKMKYMVQELKKEMAKKGK